MRKAVSSQDVTASNGVGVGIAARRGVGVTADVGDGVGAG